VTRDERGQTTLLLVGLGIVLLLLVGVTIDASAAYLRRQGLANLADGAALAAADGVQGRQVYEGGLGDTALVDPAVAREYVAAYLLEVDAAGTYPGLRFSVDATTDRIVVTVSAPLDLPIRPPGWEGVPIISSTAASYVVVSD
jgi:Flp pilus assembly protein TadG